jgi:ferrous iron transport protein B
VIPLSFKCPDERSEFQVINITLFNKGVHCPACEPSEKDSDPPEDARATATRRLLIMGNPNVGKSVIFNRLTGRYVTVSNYPGTTVEISRGKTRIGDESYEVVDTPGMYSLLPLSEEERAGRSILLNEPADALLHVADAKNLDRMLPFTLQLIEAGFPVILVVNMLDEADKYGVRIDFERLSQKLGVPVIGVVALKGSGFDDLRQAIRHYRSPDAPASLRYEADVERAVSNLSGSLTGGTCLTLRASALLMLQNDDEITERERRANANSSLDLTALTRKERSALGEAIDAAIALKRKDAARELLDGIADWPQPNGGSFGERLSRFCMSPVTGLPILALVVWFGLYQFVGVFGGGTLVGLLEENLFGEHLNPWMTAFVQKAIPWPWLSSLFVGEYGMWTLGVTYAVALILPIVGTFFLAFSTLEDSGYLPRLAMLIDRVFKKIGLTGKAVIPIALGFGCDTMATLVTRILETRRERIIATFLLSLAIPCSAQLGVMAAMLAGHSLAFGLWAGIMVGVFLIIGYLSSRLLPGESARFAMELPPLRFPNLSNVAAKTISRMQWYFLEVFPLFLFASVMIWVGQLTGLFNLALRLLTPAVRLMGLPDKTAEAFLFGFFRRDYGAAGLYRLQESGGLGGNHLLVSVVVLTLFLPCVAQFLIIKKERGLKMALSMSAFIVAFSLAVGV